MPSKIVLERLVELEAGGGEPFAAGEASEQLGLGSAGQVESSPYGRSPVGRLLASSQLDEPRAVWRGSREPELYPFFAETGLERRR